MGVYLFNKMVSVYVYLSFSRNFVSTYKHYLDHDNKEIKYNIKSNPYKFLLFIEVFVCSVKNNIFLQNVYETRRYTNNKNLKISHWSIYLFFFFAEYAKHLGHEILDSHW